MITLRAASGALWAPLAVLLVHAILGARFGHEPYVDPIMHFSGGAAAALFFRHVASRSPELVGSPSRTGLDLVAFALAAAIACSWELGELALGVLRGSGAGYDFEHTLRDVSLGLIGASTYLVGLRTLGRSGPV